MEDFEKLGSFYLGRIFDHENKKSTDSLLLYDSQDLTTHAVCVGMTGSGKTGLCISLLEEAAIDGIPALIIDPKGDMTNLALSFPELSPAEFTPWVNQDEARKAGLTVDAYAAQQAELWKNGLGKWGQDAGRIRKFKESAELSIFTPGSTSGRQISILKSFAAPPQPVIDDSDIFSERIANTATSLLGLMGIDADPLKSREHILLSNILSHFWIQNKDLDLSSLIQAVQNPPFTKIGVFELESFYPPKERFELAMALNNLLAAPAFQSWLEGEALDVSRLLYNEAGKPRISIFYIAHLADAERMFFVSMLLNQVIGWMRTQSGTTSLRALLYIDELFGYMPPISNPPSKKPLLTLLKQARAFGLGIVLATQNPVDLDYKGLSNTGTWLIGRLQTDRDRDRILDGLSGLDSPSLDRKQLEQIITGLGKRIFLLHNVHEKSPVVFETRWAMSYLAGPLTRAQIKVLNQTGKETLKPAESVKPHVGVTAKSSQPPVLPPDITQFFMPVRSIKPAGAELFYQPYLYGSALVHFFDNSKGVDQKENLKMIVPITAGPIAVNWELAISTDVIETELLVQSEGEARFAELPQPAGNKASYKNWYADFQDYLYRSQKCILFKSPSLKVISNAGEPERDFRIRLSQLARENRDEWTTKLRDKYASRISALESKIRTAEDRIARESHQASQQKVQTAISIGTTILGAFLGRKAVNRTTLNRAGTAMRNASRTQKEAADVGRARENLEILQQELDDLQNRFKEEVDAAAIKFDPQLEELASITVRPQKTAIQIQLLTFLWVPHWYLPGNTTQLA